MQIILFLYVFLVMVKLILTENIGRSIFMQEERTQSLYFFRNKCHEDIVLSMKEHKAKMVMTNIEISHTGNVKLEDWKRKNLRNLKLLLQDYHDKPHILTYYGLINSYMIKGGKKNWLRAIQLIDEAFERFKPEKTDVIVPKLWVLRGAACMDSGQLLAAKQAWHKAYDEWKHPEAAVALADIYKRDKNYDKAIEILTPIYEKKEFDVDNVPIDLITVELDMLRFLGDCWAAKGDMEGQNKQECWQKAETHYRECMSVRPDLQAADRLCQILRRTNRMAEASLITIKMVNFHPNYFVGWNNLASDELMAQRYVSAKLFLQEAIKWKPDFKEALHNLKILNEMLVGKSIDKTKRSWYTSFVNEVTDLLCLKRRKVGSE